MSELNTVVEMAEKAEAAKEWSKAIEAYRLALELEQHPDWWFRLGNNAERVKDYALAKEAYQAYLSLQSEKDPVAHALLEMSSVDIASRFILLKYLRIKLPDLQQRVLSNKSSQSGEPKLFIYWDAGFDRAPAVVRACYREMLTKHERNQVVVLDADTWRYYVTIPRHVVDKVLNQNKNQIHFSDVLRTALLARYGGIWADATCMVTKNIVSMFGDISKSGFFSYNYDVARISSWFLCSSGDNYIAKMMFEALCEYWNDFDKQINYYIFHYIFEILYYLDERFRKIWDESTKARSCDAHTMQNHMMTEYKKDAFDKMLQVSAVQKLTYKFNPDDITPDSVIAHIIRGDYCGAETGAFQKKPN